MSDKGGKQNVNSKKINKVFIIVIIAALIVIAVLVGVIVYMLHSKNTDEPEKKRTVVVTEENAEQVAEEVLGREEPQDVPMNYQVTMNSTWEFESGDKASSNAYVANSTDNETAVYFDVVRNDTQETIYQSPVIPVGGELNSIKLDTDLDAGDYECTLTYHLVDEEQNTLTTVNMWLMVKVEN